MSYQAYLDAVEKKTGKTPGELLAEAAERGFTPTTKAADVVAWLKDDYDVGRGHAMALYGVLKNGATISDKHVRQRRHPLRPVHRAPARRPREALARRGEAMFTNINVSQIFVLDQDEALDFYVGKLGLEVNTDQDLGFMRWLTVNVPGDPDRQILLERPGPPSMDEATAAQVRELVSKGVMGGWVGFVTDDCRKTYDELAAKGVEFTDGPNEQPYGIDAGIRDPVHRASSSRTAAAEVGRWAGSLARV